MRTCLKPVFYQKQPDGKSLSQKVDSDHLFTCFILQVQESQWLSQKKVMSSYPAPSAPIRTLNRSSLIGGKKHQINRRSSCMMEAFITIMDVEVKTSTSEDGSHISHKSCSLVTPPSSSGTPRWLTVESTPVIFHICSQNKGCALNLLLVSRKHPENKPFNNSAGSCHLISLLPEPRDAHKGDAETSAPSWVHDAVWKNTCLIFAFQNSPWKIDQEKSQVSDDVTDVCICNLL